MSKTEAALLEVLAAKGFVFVDSDRSREVAAAAKLEQAGKIRRDKTKDVRGFGISSHCYVAA